MVCMKIYEQKHINDWIVYILWSKGHPLVAPHMHK